MSDLRAFLEAIRVNREDDTHRLVFADWLDENHPAPAVQFNELPKGFNAHWHANAMAHLLGVRDMPRSGRGKWSSADILAGFKAAAERTKLNWTARAGATEIENLPLLVFEPSVNQIQALGLCKILQRVAGGCPVSFNRCGTVKRPRMRLGVWFTVQPTEEQASAEFAAIMDRIFRTDPTRRE